MPPFMFPEEPISLQIPKNWFTNFFEKMRVTNLQFERLFSGLAQLDIDPDDPAVRSAREALCDAYLRYQSAVQKSIFTRE